MKTTVLSNEICRRLDITPTAELPQRHGQICLANDSLLSQASYVSEITGFAIGYEQSPTNSLLELLNIIAPPRPGGRDVRITVYDEHEPFETVSYEDVKRSILAEPKEIKQRKSSKATISLENLALTVKLDRDQLVDKPDWQRVHTQWLQDLINRASVIRALTVLRAAAVTDTWTWNTANNPDMDVMTALVTLSNVIGFKPNTGLYGDAAWLKRVGAYEEKNTPAAGVRAGYTEAQLATATGLSQARVNVERYNGAANVKTEFLGSRTLLFTSVASPSPADATNLVRFTAPANQGGGNIAVYVTEVGVKSIYLTVEKYESLYMQHTSGILDATIQ